MSTQRETKANNLLPYDGEVCDYGQIYSQEESAFIFNQLYDTLHWQCDKIKLFGKVIESKRLIAWYADKPYAYTYSGNTKIAEAWTQPLAQIKVYIEKNLGIYFNCCLLNLYINGQVGIAWHSDNESCLGKFPKIAILSLGEVRTLSFKHKISKKLVKIILDSGQLILMKGVTQDYWLHQIAKSKMVKDARISLTFRRIVR